MIYRSMQPQTLYVVALGRDVPADGGQPFDDRDPDDAKVIAEWGPKGRGILLADNIEAATAAPGEVRTARRAKPAA
jgi:hypothetical protein